MRTQDGEAFAPVGNGHNKWVFVGKDEVRTSECIDKQASASCPFGEGAADKVRDQGPTRVGQQPAEQRP